MRVTVFDYAALPTADLKLILATAGRLLGDAGVRVRWAHCLPSATPAPPVCNAPLERGGLALRLLAAAPPMLDPAAPPTLGFAVLDEAGAGVMASVYLDRVERLGRASSTEAVVVRAKKNTIKMGTYSCADPKTSRRPLPERLKPEA